ncbi:DUF805 domain-containing protein [Kocuria sp. JC486]|uniref:DUF805 domain-containing protein n=1 Tax=Kocuria soli TaxID=2485125 RepID=A0A3N3ZRP9_9MICC|nr:MULTISPECIES: DUF805 domain-containing protein [Kocuria]NHU85394.1 DUF805 domain-containing protein [Kocuria sp. JC486]ROZ62223.1 DUF805 domain-containing protein [Kocuria soli]
MSYGINPQDSAPQNSSDSEPKTGYDQPSFGQAAQDQPAYGQAPTAQTAQTQLAYGYPTGSQPGEQVNFVGAIKNFFRKYAQFSGRASRSEFWWAYLALGLVGLLFLVLYVAGVITVVASADPVTGAPSGGGTTFVILVLVLGSLVGLATVVPQISLTVRRLHDTNKPGWYYFVACVPFVGSVILLVLCAAEPDPAGAAFDA